MLMEEAGKVRRRDRPPQAFTHACFVEYPGRAPGHPVLANQLPAGCRFGISSMTKLIARIASAGQALIDLALPPRCVTCRELTMGQAGLCPRCWSTLTFIDAPRCAGSGLPFPYGVEGD